jgi:hypothetical protein
VDGTLGEENDATQTASPAGKGPLRMHRLVWLRASFESKARP